MQNYFSGQRWISETEPEFGLGLVVDVTPRAVQVFYQAANEIRQYAIGNAPLKRVRFAEGDSISTREGAELKVALVREDAVTGLLTYVADDGTELVETELCDTSSFDRPESRLVGGHIDENALFELRISTLEARHRYGRLSVRGLLGGRVDLLPHQLFIADEVSSRALPRVLLADEVGLGKTIEACLILHRLLVCGQISRVLILVPHALVHQWFVELLRRFNLAFSLFNEERCVSIEAGDPEANPFLDDQLVLCSVDYLAAHPERAAQAIGADWDLLIVDEAHHLHWSPDQASPEYELVERLSRSIARLLLLTASPEQMGLESHFARLRLLDPHRYPNLTVYKEEHAHYAEVAKEIGARLESLSEEELSEQLDRHGPGRVIFRNTRRCMSGFPKRIPDLVPLAVDGEHPRMNWLLDFLRTHPNEKVLVICKTRKEVTDVADAVRDGSGIDTAHFHEQMSLVQCDRQAAWFAEPEGARVMVVSEMGGEGRNFQMASHLVLIDLPRDPELLEQRIGRLDRIGQRGDVYIHVPYLLGTEEEQIARWLHEGLNAFEHPVVGGFELIERFGAQLETVTDSVIAETRAFYESLRKKIAAGRDRLLELSSYRPECGAEVAAQIRVCEQSPALKEYLLQTFEQYGVQAEALDSASYHIRPGQLFDDWFPLSAEGKRITFDRDESLIRPDVTLMSWDHPMVTGAMELVLGSERGSCAMAVDPSQVTPLKLEAVYVLETMAPTELNAARFLPPTPLSICVDHAGEVVEPPSASGLGDAEPWRLMENESLRQHVIPSMIESTRTPAEEAAKPLIDAARKQMHQLLGEDYKRLEYLKTVNDNIRGAELKSARKAMLALDGHLASARLRLDAVRLIIPSEE